MSEALYLTDSYLREWEAEVREVNQGKFIVLDRTSFYPNSGGQPFDTGTMTTEDGKEFRVVFAGKFSGQISHEVDREGLKPGDKVKCALDWDRRYRLMRMHTAAHIISQVLHLETGAMITGGQLDTERSRTDFSVEEFDREKLKDHEEKANEVAEKGLEVVFEFYEGEEIQKIMQDPGMTKLAKGFPPNIKVLRLVKIGDFDCQADGGTHVKNTREVGKINFVDFANKGKNNRRIYFTLG